jgi:hypothetical protein
MDSIWAMLSILNFLEVKMLERGLFLMESLFVLLLLRRGITIVKSKIRKSRIVEWLLLGIVRMILLRRRVIIRKGLMLQGSHQLKLWLL